MEGTILGSTRYLEGIPLELGVSGKWSERRLRASGRLRELQLIAPGRWRELQFRLSGSRGNFTGEYHVDIRNYTEDLLVGSGNNTGEY